MPKKPETLFAEKFDRILKDIYGTDVVIFNIQQRTKRGDPDRLICIRGSFVAVELKEEAGRLSPLQSIKLKEVRQARGLSLVVTPSTLDYALDELMEAFVPEGYRT